VPRSVNISGVRFPLLPFTKKKIKNRSPDRRLDAIYLFSFSNFPFGFHMFPHRLQELLPFGISKVENISVRVLNWQVKGNFSGEQ